jgi:hypothetical protein
MIKEQSMKRRIGIMALGMGMAMMGAVQAIDVTWVGGASGDWNDPNVWSDGTTTGNAKTIFGAINGSEIETDIVISGATVSYDYRRTYDDLGEPDPDGTAPNDFRLTQLSTLTINNGGAWEQVIDDSFDANHWTRMNPTLLDLDNGTFRRSGTTMNETQPNDEGEDVPTGGLLTFGGLTGSVTDQVTEIRIHNGGKLINDGVLSFGYDNGLDKTGMNISMTIDNGTVDLTGGSVNPDGPDDIMGTGDLIFVQHLADDDPLKPVYAINFTGPGTIITDNGIGYPRKADGFEYTDYEKKSWEELWAVGILQANGKSGLDGMNFSDFFTTTGQKEGENYTLTSKVGGLLGDFNSDSLLTAADIDALSAEVRAGTNPPAFDVNSDSLVNQTDRTVWVEQLKRTYMGDANLDGVFDSADFVAVFQVGEYEDTTPGNSGWADGDWDGNSDFDSGDFVAAFQAGGYEKGPRPAANAVPEPVSWTAALVGLAALGSMARRRRQ